MNGTLKIFVPLFRRLLPMSWPIGADEQRRCSNEKTSRQSIPGGLIIGVMDDRATSVEIVAAVVASKVDLLQVRLGVNLAVGVVLDQCRVIECARLGTIRIL